jgi:hypothetical protein
MLLAVAVIPVVALGVINHFTLKFSGKPDANR